MAIKLEFSDALKAASEKYLGDGATRAERTAKAQAAASAEQQARMHREAIAASQKAQAAMGSTEVLSGFNAQRVGEPVDLMPETLNPTREQARAAMHAALDGILDELEQGSHFVGLQIDLHRLAGKDNQIACVNFVPIDLISGTPARRIPQPA